MKTKKIQIRIDENKLKLLKEKKINISKEVRQFLDNLLNVMTNKEKDIVCHDKIELKQEERHDTNKIEISDNYALQLAINRAKRH